MDTDWTSEWEPPPPDLPQLGPETLDAVRALQGGELDESTRHLFETFEPELSAYFRRHGCQADEADDLTQTVFIRMLEQIETLKDASSFHFWLFKIAGNYLRNFVRDRARSREGDEAFADQARGHSEPSAFWARGMFEPSPETNLAMSETTDERRLFLCKLLQVTKLAPQTCRSLVRRLYGETYEEIAEALEIPAGTVRSHVSRASAALFKNLDKVDVASVPFDALDDVDDDIVTALSSELLTFKREVLEADSFYFRAGTLEAAGADYEEAEERDDEALILITDEDDEDGDEMETVERVVDSPAEIAAVVREDRARGRSRRRVTRTILPAGHNEKDPDLGRLDKDDLAYPAILIDEAAALLGDVSPPSCSPRGDSGAFSVHSADRDLALKAKLTCAGSLLARGRRFRIARQVGEIVRQAIDRMDNGQCLPPLIPPGGQCLPPLIPPGGQCLPPLIPPGGQCLPPLIPPGGQCLPPLIPPGGQCLPPLIPPGGQCDELRRKVAEGRTLLRSYLGRDSL